MLPVSATDTPVRDRFVALDGLRGWAVTLVFLVHFCGSYALQRRSVDFDAVTDVAGMGPVDQFLYWLFFSHYGVQIFFAISGFVISRSIAGSRTLREYLIFLGHRVLRIYPAFLLSLALAAIVAASVYGDAIDWTTLSRNLVFLNGAFALGIPGYNYVTWSLFYEFAFYLIFPLLFVFAVNTTRNPRQTAPAMWFAFLVLLGIAGFTEWFLFLPFLAGVCAGLMSDQMRIRLARRLPDALLVLSYVGTTTTAMVYLPLPQFRSNALVSPAGMPVFLSALAIIVTLAIIRVSSGEGFLFRWLTRSPMLALGRVSYSFFLLHGVVLQVVFGLTQRQYHGSLVSAILLGTFCFAISWALANLLYLIAEKPYYRLRGASWQWR